MIKYHRMSKYFRYQYILILILIGYSGCSDDLNHERVKTEDCNKDETNFNQTGHTLVSRNIIERGLGHIVYDSYGSESVSTTQPVEQSSESDIDQDIDEPVEPETIPVEVGSDEEEDEDEEDNFQVTETTEITEGVTGTQTVGPSTDTEDDYKEEKPTEIDVGYEIIHPELSTTIFMGFDDKRKFIIMDHRHFYITTDNTTDIKIEFGAKLYEIKQDNKLVWKGKKYKSRPQCVIYKKLTNVFLIIFPNSFFSCKYVNGNWEKRINIIPEIVLYYVNYLGKHEEIDGSNIITEYTQYGSVRKYIKYPTMCTMIEVGHQKLWEKKYIEKYPREVHCYGNKKIVIVFVTWKYIYLNHDGIWKFEKSIKTK
ncbi:Theileria-specific sub-telomeric protein, SVSP family, putative [Theileria annulata]|uniref:Theileria-specific sub-telomeric protein, SVSP family, putative n=1 Tax=Theileria annulata TaxID=5874 RepID=Q4UAT6_THEAN|nr:Theileria-specific sub-telomeric protein, SVSP family, putative [Theileria annulata]CAI76065.1 Theileria-specific sub-telomeric protein, SVSP family, putative [Theileria annulata]|eukprot:XP_955541.1 Theileria-specific sub-telomeric protein, SVSP family, putative [Theileria annulata]